MNCRRLNYEFWVRARYFDGEDGSQVAIAATVVGRREDSEYHRSVLPLGPHMSFVPF